MGILSRIMGRKPEPEVDIRPSRTAEFGSIGGKTSTEWNPPENLDPHQRDLATLMLRLRDQVADMSPADAIKRMGPSIGWHSEALVPLPGPARSGWTDTRMFTALSRDEDYMTLKGNAERDVLEAIDHEMVRRLVSEPDTMVNLAERSYVLRSDVTNRMADFMKDGPRLDERVSRESEMLERQSSAVIAERFQDTPILSMGKLPDRGEARRAWLEDVLRAEHSAAKEGMMSPSAIVKAASARRGEVPMHWEAAPVVQDRTQEIQRMVAKEAIEVERMSDASLRSRYRDVPGVVQADIPDMARPAERRTWIEGAVTAQKARQSMAWQSEGIRMESVEKPTSHLAMSREVGQSALKSEKRQPVNIAAQRSFAVASFMER